GTAVTVGAAAEPPPPGGPELMAIEAQDATKAAGGKLCKEEVAKREKHPFKMTAEMEANAAAGQFPKGTDVLLYKFSGMFYVAPAQDAYMCRMRFPGGQVTAPQLRGIADMSETHAGGYIDITTRGNLQYREIPVDKPVEVIRGLMDLGVIIRGSGADNVRNVTGTATAGFDRQEFLDTLPLAKDMHHHILSRPELYGLPRKFNISFEGGGVIATLEDTNDIGFQAVRVTDDQATAELPAGVYMRLTLGGITGHFDFARPTGVILEPGECVEVADAILRVFIKNGDRTNRKKARLKYLLDDWGFDKYIGEVEAVLGRTLKRAAEDQYEMPPAPDRWAHVGVHEQAQEGKRYIGVVFPVGRMTAEQGRRLADLAYRYGGGYLRLTVWQNLLIPDVDEADVETVVAEIKDMGLDVEASSVRAGLVACTGNAGCKFAGADTKGQAMRLADYLEERVELDTPINIHFTGCHHSCAQHYIGDIGFEGTKVEVGDDMVEGYHMAIGGGYADTQGIGRVLIKSLAFDDIPPTVERLINHYLENRVGPAETFVEFSRRAGDEELIRAARGTEAVAV
ncbi:MAG: NirA family protein, partial [Planctomycetota bacterium]